jgi:hypothetical protein
LYTCQLYSQKTCAHARCMSIRLFAVKTSTSVPLSVAVVTCRCTAPAAAAIASSTTTATGVSSSHLHYCYHYCCYCCCCTQVRRISERAKRCCSCTDNCANPERCECQKGRALPVTETNVTPVTAYDETATGVLTQHAKPPAPQMILHECNLNCPCNAR